MFFLIGDSLQESTEVRKITFTGSTGVGKKLMAGASETVKKVSLELGGNAPCIIFDDVDLEAAVKGSLSTKFHNTGQQCVCTNRVLVQEGIYEKFINAYSKAVQNLKVGNGLSEGVTQGPLINDAAVQKSYRSILMTYKHKTHSVGADGKTISNADINFYISDDLIHVIESKTPKNYGDYFLRQIVKTYRWVKWKWVKWSRDKAADDIAANLYSVKCVYRPFCILNKAADDIASNLYSVK